MFVVSPLDQAGKAEHIARPFLRGEEQQMLRLLTKEVVAVVAEV